VAEPFGVQLIELHVLELAAPPVPDRHRADGTVRAARCWPPTVGLPASRGAPLSVAAVYYHCPLVDYAAPCRG
jgi:hypothetical protein